MKHNPAKFRFTTRNPWRAKYFLGIPKTSTNCSSTLAGVSYNTLVRLAEQNKWHGPLPLVHAIMPTRLVSNNSAYWPIYEVCPEY